MQEETDLQNKTLFDLFSEALEKIDSNDLPGWYYYEQYVEYRKKYLQALFTEATVLIHSSTSLSSLNLKQEDVDTTSEVLRGVYQHYFKLQKESLENLIKILDEHASFKSVKAIRGYTEFDRLEWDIDEFGKVKIKFKPKDTSVSFWHADPKDIEII